IHCFLMHPKGKRIGKISPLVPYSAGSGSFAFFHFGVRRFSPLWILLWILFWRAAGFAAFGFFVGSCFAWGRFFRSWFCFCFFLCCPYLRHEIFVWPPAVVSFCCV